MLFVEGNLWRKLQTTMHHTYTQTHVTHLRAVIHTLHTFTHSFLPAHATSWRLVSIAITAKTMLV